MIMEEFTSYIIDTTADTLQNTCMQNHNGSRSWFYIAIIEFLIILILLFVLRKKSKVSGGVVSKKEVLDGEVDFVNLHDSIWKSQALYDKLKVKCHPDRFPTDPEKSEIAGNLFQEISKNKNDYNKLLELKKQAENKLNIKF